MTSINISRDSEDFSINSSYPSAESFPRVYTKQENPSILTNGDKTTDKEHPISLAHTFSNTSNFTTMTNLSKITSLKQTISHHIVSIRDAVNDDNEQTYKEESNVENLLKAKFELGDATRLSSYILEYPSSINDDAIEDSCVNSNAETSNKDGSNLGKKRKEASQKTLLSRMNILEKVFPSTYDSGTTDLPPDGGYGWVSTFCTFLAMFSTWGCNSGFGVFLAFYLNNNTFKGATEYDYCLIAGLTICLGPLLSPIGMITMKIIGIKLTMWIGIMMLLAGFLMSSYSTRLWELYLTQGALVGASYSFIAIPATTVIPGWFLKKRAVAMGISMIGTGAGGVTYSLAANKMIQDNNGTRQCLRVFCITCVVACAISAILIKPYHKEHPIGFRSKSKIKNEFKVMFDLNVIRRPVVWLVTVWFTFALFAYNLMIFTLSSYVVARGMSQHDGSTITAIVNGCQAIGRPIMGLVGDRVGRINITVVLTLCLTIFFFAFWIPAHTFLQLIFLAICLGSCIGVANVMSTVLIADVVAPEEFLTAWAFVNYFSSPFFLVCEVIAQALKIKKPVSNPYIHTQIFAGLCIFVALCLVCCLRSLSVNNKLKDRQTETLKSLDNLHKDLSSKISEQEYDILEKRKVKYVLLLGGGIKKFFIRMFYPMKV
ncbi:hypothetical protein TBLA_0C05480 [Henningerozyma blattae CBS 6284]|uniref:Major facilitator superfamily (MFS) profile domain-containing protein n=1 Tax=Henningerozyma blattae (strain ATCC 34711 / CBS 6284 / DSM 70876 / NBRC 10599 / NRRL Y-10934 / UCD 77-7) TaxID=1071380 RepID=I2H1U4_HENB6|nr:hypothetical protein TBLA_0C05480 [Tetrapisispora blattae CBS 6284]CCH60346.1 hypothetical protein TBLA_0C05480 [Tetrapisispora blattae CBS 6284]